MIADFVDQVVGFFRTAFAPTAEAEAASAAADAEVDLTEEGSRIAAWLPYVAYRPSDKVFINRDAIGFILETSPQTGADQDLADRLKGLYTRLPVDGTMQIQLWASPNIDSTLRHHSGLRVQDADAAQQANARGGRPARNKNVFRTIARRNFAHLRRGSQEHIAPDITNLVRNYRSFVSVTVPGNLKDLNRLDTLLEIRDGVLSTLKSAHFPARVMGAEDVIDLLKEWLNPARLRGSQTTPPHYDDTKLVSEQIVDRETTGDWKNPAKVTLSRLGSESDQVELRFFSIQKTPKTFALWGMGGLIGDMFQDTLQIPCPFLVTMGVSMPDQQRMASQAVAEKAQADRGAKGDLAKFTPGLHEKNAAWDQALRAMGDGGKLVWCYHEIMLFAKPGASAQRAESALRDLYLSRGFELTLDGYIHRVALLQSVPMGLSRPFMQDLAKLKRLELRTSGNTIHLAPLIAEGKGTGTPTLLGVGRRGQLVSLDFFDNHESGKNVAIVGAIGSGKSTLLQAIALAYASRGAKVRVFESGRSFERMTSQVGGTFMRFTPENRPRINPFSMVSDVHEINGETSGGIDDDVALLQPLLAKMASPNEPLDPAVYASLAVIIKEEYTRLGRSMTTTDVQRRFAEGRLYPDRPADQRFYDMAVMLAPFSKGGAYATYFEGPATLDFSNDFMVFELQELSNNPHLRGVVQMILLYRVTQEYLEERSRQKVFIMDEAKEALAGSGADDLTMAQFLEKLYLRVRKYHGCAITATQDVAHYFISPYGASIWNQSEYIILGKQSENSIEAIGTGHAIRLDEPLRRLLSSIASSTGSYREWYIHSGLFKGVVRLMLDPYTLLLMSNRAEDNGPLDRELAAGKSISQAIDAVLRDRGLVEAA